MVQDANNPCWVSYFDGAYMTNLGTDKIVFRCSDLFAIVDLKDGTTDYLDSSRELGNAGVMRYCGHPRLPIIAFSELIMRPRVFLYTVHNDSLYCTFDSPNVTMYLDLKFSEHDLLVGMTSHPNYTLRFWNIRTVQLVYELDTMVAASLDCLLITNHSMPTVFVYSIWSNAIYAFEMCHRDKHIEVFETADFPLTKDYSHVQKESFATIDDGKLYVINQKGVIAHVDYKLYRTTEVWGTPFLDDDMPVNHSLFSGRNSLIVATEKRLISVRKRQNMWMIDWVVETGCTNIMKAFTTMDMETIAADEIGHSFKVKVSEGVGELVPVTNKKHITVKDFWLPKLIKDETLMVLGVDELKHLDISNMNELAVEIVPEATLMYCLSTFPVLAVATSKGVISFYSYEKYTEFTLLGSVDIGVPLTQILMTEAVMVAEDEKNFYFIQLDLKNNLFSWYATIENEITGVVHKVSTFLIDSEHFAVCLGRDKFNEMFYISEMWIYEYKIHKPTYKKSIYILPGKYLNVYCGSSFQRSGTEIFGVKYISTIVDIFYFTTNGVLKWDSSLKTPHIGCILCLSYNKNLLTWSGDGAFLHFRTHKSSPKPYRAAKRVNLKYRPVEIKKSYECYNFKYFISAIKNGQLRCRAVNITMDNVAKNEELIVDVPIINPKKVETKLFTSNEESAEMEIKFTEEDLLIPAMVRRDLAALALEVAELIQYDMDVTGKTAGVFSKFCLNNVWLRMLNEQARLLCNIERESLDIYTKEQERIRDWIKSVIFRYSDYISYKIRAIYSNIMFENYQTRRATDNFAKEFDYVRFYDLEKDSDDEDEQVSEAKDDESSEENTVVAKPVAKKRYVIPPGSTAYDHCMAPEFAMQDIKCATVNLFIYEKVMFQVKLRRLLKEEFNKLFNEVRKFKEDNIDSVTMNNNALKRIYENMNIMLKLLGMDTFEPPKLVVPQWMDNEIVERMLEVDESEVKAINRRKKKAMEMAKKEGRMLLWSIEFWSRALMQMMDGVLEKLWEEEIKKDIPIPEFMMKKSPHEYTIEDNRLLKEYEEKVKNLENDRRKYLRILKESEGKALKQKAQNILKINERVAFAGIEKVKYDFAIRHVVLRILNCSKAHLHRITSHKEIDELKAYGEKVQEFSEKCINLLQIWETSVADVKLKTEAAVAKDRQIEKQFRGGFLSNIPANTANELLKIYRKRPKVNVKMFNNAMIAYEVAQRLVTKSVSSSFPLPHEYIDFLETYNKLDAKSACPNLLDLKQWEQFCKIRRSKTEAELRAKAAQLQLSEATAMNANANADLEGLTVQKGITLDKMNAAIESMLLNIQNMNLQITLTNGQVEVDFGGIIDNLSNSILMNIDDINAVNELIMKAGRMKLRVMHRVAAFRRQVIFREWEHKMYCANIAYLRNVLTVIEKSKVSKEFLDILRKWDKIKDQREYMMKVGIIEQTVKQKIDAYRVNLDRVIDNIMKTRAKIEDVKVKNRNLSRRIELVKVDVTFANLKRDELLEEKHQTDLKERMTKIRQHHQLLTNVRKDYARILELNTILELQRLRTFPTLAPAPPLCPPLKDFCQ